MNINVEKALRRLNESLFDSLNPAFGTSRLWWIRTNFMRAAVQPGSKDSVAKDGIPTQLLLA